MHKLILVFLLILLAGSSSFAQEKVEVFHFQNLDSLEGIRQNSIKKGVYRVKKEDGTIVVLDSANVVEITSGKAWVTKNLKPVNPAEPKIQPSLQLPGFSPAPFYSLDEIFSGTRLVGVFGMNYPTGFWDNYSTVGLVFGADLIVPLTRQINWHLNTDYQWNWQKFTNKIVDVALFDDGTNSYGYKSWRSIWVLTGPSIIFAGENDDVRFEPGVNIGFSYISYPGQDLFEGKFSESTGLAYEISLPFIFGKTKTVEFFSRWSKISYDESRYSDRFQTIIYPSFSRNFNEVGIRLKFRLERFNPTKK
ncbi:MAG: hypothetical protein J0L62_06835 [Bacteroidetes bacterium]|nr:hypothetical protein [Bacteroidota bacterium]